MQNEFKIKEIEEKIAFLFKTPSCYERNLLIAELQAKLEDKKNTKASFNFVMHHKHMSIDLYTMIGKDLYGHFKRLIDTMNENNVCDMDMLDIKKSQKYIVKEKLESFGLIKEIKGDFRSKIFVNPLFALSHRKTVNSDLEEYFRDVNRDLYGIDLKTFTK